MLSCELAKQFIEVVDFLVWFGSVLWTTVSIISGPDESRCNA